MAEPKIKVESKAETIESEKTQQQKKDAKAIGERKAEAEKEAEAARKEAEKKKQEEAEARARAEKEEAERKAKEEAAAAEKTEQLAALGTAAAAAALKGSSKIKWSDFVKGLLVGLLCGALLTYFILDRLYQGIVADLQETETESQSSVEYTVDDFSEAILGAASEHAELVVMEQPLSINTTVTKSGLANLSIFEKIKEITYYGTGVYTVDLSHIDQKHIKLDNFNKTVNILIPHAVLQYVNPDLDKTEFQDTEKGWLAFGDIKLTAEETSELEKSVYSAMEERLSQDDVLTQADEFALLKTWEIFQPLITAVSPEYTVEMEFEE